MNLIKTYPAVPFDDLMYCPQHEIAYQADMTQSVEYGQDYFDKYIDYEGSRIATELNAARTGLTQRYCRCVIDVGIGSGEFIKKSKIKAYGFDINKVAEEWLRINALFVNPYEYIPDDIEGFCFWDVLEHIPEPNDILSKITAGKYAFVSIPIFKDVIHVRESKHYRPNEHYYYFTEKGFVGFMRDSGFQLREMNNLETMAGREGILTFVFQKQ